MLHGVPLQGKVVESGSHAELLGRGGKYAELWARQSTVDDLTETPVVHEESRDAEVGSSGCVGDELLEEMVAQDFTADRQSGAGAAEPLERRLEGAEPRTRERPKP